MPHRTMMDDSGFQRQQNNALIICDVQNDSLKCLSSGQSEILLTSINAAQDCIESSFQTRPNDHKHKWTVIYTGLQFESDYNNVPSDHKLYGGMKRLNRKMGNDAAHWFMEGYEGTKIACSVLSDDNDESPNGGVGASLHDAIHFVWRDRHLPSDKLSKILTDPSRNITTAIICGMKTSTTLQSTVQAVCDLGIRTKVLKEGVADDNLERQEAIMKHLIPIYAEVITLSEMMDDIVGIENINESCRHALINVSSSTQTALPGMTTVQTPPVEKAPNNDRMSKSLRPFSSIASSNKSRGSNVPLHPPVAPKFCTDCERGGHGTRYIQFLLERPGWRTYPSQPWYENFHGAYRCPLGRKVVDFCDEPEFSKLSMYLSGRDWLDEKDKVTEIAQGYMPTTYCWEPASSSSGHGKWRDGISPPRDSDPGALGSPWFIKEADKNLGGPYIGICLSPSDIHNFIKPDRRYVVQQHVKDPLLTDDGKKTHVKFYILLICEDDGETWSLYTCKKSKLSISPNPWSPTDLSQDTQVTIHRHPVLPEETEGWKQHWVATYIQCQNGTADVIRRAIQMGKLKGRKGKKQFEVFSADWMPDEHGRVWLFEFNMSPAVYQKQFDDAEKRDSRREKLMQDDEIMLRDALSIVLPFEGGSEVGLWEKVELF